MKKALRMMQEMQAFLAERQIEAHVNTTVFESSVDGTVHHACEITVFCDEGIVAKVSWGSYRAEAFEAEVPIALDMGAKGELEHEATAINQTNAARGLDINLKPAAL